MNPATKLVVFVAIHFMILFTAFNAYQTIVTRIHQEEGDIHLGPFRLAMNYIAFMTSNLFVAKVPYSEKWQITLATLTYAIQYSTGFFMAGKSTAVKYILASFGSVINGIGASFLWTSVGSYIHKVCHLHNKMSQKGHYFGLFNTIFCSSTLLGGIVVTFGLTLFSHDIYFILVTGFAMLAFFYGIFFIKDISLPEQKLKQQQEIQGIWQRALASAKSTIHFYPIMKYSLGLISLDGISLGVISGTMLRLLPKQNTNQDNLLAGVALMIYGVGCIIGGYLGGKLCDKLQIRISSSLTSLFYIISCLFSIGAYLIFEIWSAFITTFLWGWTLFFITANLMVLCSRVYKGRPESFALTKQFHSLLFVIYEVVSMSTNNQLPIYYIMFALLLFAGPALWGAYHLRQEKQNPSFSEEQNKENNNENEKEVKEGEVLDSSLLETSKS